MGIRLDIDLDEDGNHTFTWHQSDAPGALHVPETLLQRWQQERDAFTQAQRRWQQVMQEIEDFLLDYEPPPAVAAKPVAFEAPQASARIPRRAAKSPLCGAKSQ